MDYRKELLKDFLQWFVKGVVELKHHGEIIDRYLAESESISIEPPVKTACEHCKFFNKEILK